MMVRIFNNVQVLNVLGKIKEDLMIEGRVTELTRSEDKIKWEFNKYYFSDKSRELGEGMTRLIAARTEEVYREKLITCPNVNVSLRIAPSEILRYLPNKPLIDLMIEMELGLVVSVSYLKDQIEVTEDRLATVDHIFTVDYLSIEGMPDSYTPEDDYEEDEEVEEE